MLSLWSFFLSIVILSVVNKIFKLELDIYTYLLFSVFIVIFLLKLSFPKSIIGNEVESPNKQNKKKKF
jgi:hypothetical protein